METLTRTNEQVILERKLKRHSINEYGYLFIKRVMDIIGSLVGFLLFFLAYIIVGMLIKIEDPKGPILFKQTRIGKDEKPFTMYKFRSMVSNAEELLENLKNQNEVEGPMFKMKEDPRILKIGRFIRKTSIDELPQFLNVFKGEMSLVGPRPPLPIEIAEYTNYDKLRLTVTPGITGLWQVSGRSNLNFKQMVELDLEYINSRSILLDIVLILKTIAVFKGSKNAY